MGHLEAGLGRTRRSLRKTIVGTVALMACAGCSTLTGLTGPEVPAQAPGATAGASTAGAPPPGAPSPVQPSPAPPPAVAAAPPPPPPPTTTASTSFTSRVKNWFVGNPSESLPAAPSASQASIDFDCPTVDYRQGAATLSVNDPKAENQALSLKYQASFVKTARECDVRGDTVTIRVGVQGRVVVGPAGSPGTVTIPLRYALVREGIEPKVLWTKLFTFPVSVTNVQLNVPFTHVEEEMTVPVPPAAELPAYVVYIGFDPEGVKPPEKPKPAPKPKSARAR
jgi:hypothetical protein